MSQVASPASGKKVRQSRVKREQAAQACQACRRRKLKCDESRPRCSNCRNSAQECDYRHPVEMQIAEATGTVVDSINRLEAKFDHFVHGRSGNPGPGDPSLYSTDSSTPSASRSATIPALGQIPNTGESPIDPNSAWVKTNSIALSYLQSRPFRSSRPLTVPNSILFWPSVHESLLSSGACAASDLDHLLMLGTAWFVKRELDSNLSILPAHLTLTTNAIPAHWPPNHDMGVTFSELTLTSMLQYTEAYFNTFNVLLPILSRRLFKHDVLDHVLRIGFVDGDRSSVIALLVFALGAVAIEGSSTYPISVIDGHPSGIRGGSTRQPPGLAIFNEARRRIGMLPATDTLEKVQALLLQGIYSECAARYMEFWHCLTAASMSCQVLIRCESSDWDSPRGDMVKRAYWTCVVSEEFFHVDLDLPRTGITLLEDEVPMPHFHEVREEEHAGEFPIEQRLEFNVAYFLALITLRRIITRTHALLQESEEDVTPLSGDSRMRLLGEMSDQLIMWREALPESLKWVGGEESLWRETPSTTTPISSTQADGSETGFNFNDYDRDSGKAQSAERYQHPTQYGFSQGQTNLGSLPTGGGFNLDIVTAALRTRFYYARFMIHLPFVYKTLHSPQELSALDTENCLIAIHSACDWPLFVAPPRNKKRLVPNLFTWTQNCIGMLLILHMAMENPHLHATCEGCIPLDRIRRAVTMMLDWIHDIRQIDTIAQWGWQILEPLLFSSRSS